MDSEREFYKTSSVLHEPFGDSSRDHVTEGRSWSWRKHENGFLVQITRKIHLSCDLAAGYLFKSKRSQVFLTCFLYGSGQCVTRHSNQRHYWYLKGILWDVAPRAQEKSGKFFEQECLNWG